MYVKSANSRHEQISQIKQAEQQSSIPESFDVFKPYLHVNADGTPPAIDQEKDDVEMAVALSALVSIIVDNYGEQTPHVHMLQHVVNPHMMDMMQHALSTVGSVAPRKEIDCNPVAASVEIKNTLQKLETLQKCQTNQKSQRQDEHLSVTSQSSARNKVQTLTCTDCAYRYRCEFCGLSFARKASFARHQQQHLRGKPFECGVCHKRFSSRRYRKQHKLCATA